MLDAKLYAYFRDKIGKMHLIAFILESIYFRMIEDSKHNHYLYHSLSSGIQMKISESQNHSKKYIDYEENTLIKQGLI